MRFPLILIRNTKRPYPELITAPWQLGQPGLDVLLKRDEWVGSNCYMDGAHSRIIGVRSPRKCRFWESLLHRSKPAYWNISIEMSPIKEYELDIIKMELMQAVDRPAFKVHLDYCNMLNSIDRYRHASEFITKCFTLLGKDIVSVHAKDALITQGALPVNINEVQPGAGSLDLSLVTALAHGLGEDIPVFVEHLDTHEQYMQATAVMREAAKRAGVPVK